MREILETFNQLLGLELEAKDLSVLQMSLRAFVVFIVAIVMIRLGSKRFMGNNTALDVMLGIVFGSLISRAVTGNAPFSPTLAAGIVLVFLHWILSFIAFRSNIFGDLVKGKKTLLVENGEIRWENMKKSHITESDLQEAVRNQGHETGIEQVKSAHLERNGDISVIMREDK